MLFLHFATLLTIFLIFQVNGAAVGGNFDCTVRHLKEKGLLNENYPVTSQDDQALCILRVPHTISIAEAAIRLRLTEEDKKDCIMENFRNASLVDYMMRKEAIEEATHIEKSEQISQIQSANNKLHLIFNEAAKACNSDPKYGGKFDAILGSINSTLAAKQRNYCVLKLILDNKLIETETFINANPFYISTDDVDCGAIIEQEKSKQKNEIQANVEKIHKPGIKMQCILDKYDELKFFETLIAFETLDLIDIPLNEKLSNREKLSQLFARFSSSLFACVSGFAK